jgi:hypothetical protein
MTVNFTLPIVMAEPTFRLLLAAYPESTTATSESASPAVSE